MGDSHEIQLQFKATPAQLEAAQLSPDSSTKRHRAANTLPIQVPPLPIKQRWRWWFAMFANIVVLLGGQAAGVLLGRLYFNEGGSSNWLETLVQSAGAPLLAVPFLFLRLRSKKTSSSSPFILRDFVKMAAMYCGFGVLIAGDNLMYTYGLLYMPVSTYSLLCATQLAFNAVFSYFLNAQKFTALIFNSVALLTFSAALIGVNSGSDTASNVPAGKYTLGFVLTLGASATFSLILSLMQLTFEKVLKSQSILAVLELQLWSNTAATAVTAAGLFISGEWRRLSREMDGYQAGKVSYVMTLAWTAICWQLSSLGTLGLIAMVSSLFSNTISTLGLPLVPVLAVIFFHEKMNGVKVIALLIAVWGFLSYIYQHYLDDSKPTPKRAVNAVVQDSL